MERGRRRRGFEQAGCIRADELGLTRRRARELTLRAAWQQVAGEALAERARVVSVARGVLEIAVDDERWLEAARALLPVLVGRLSARYPQLGVRRCRLRTRERVCLLAADTRPEEESAGDEAGERATEDGGGGPQPLTVAARLERLMERYLGRR